MNTALKPLTSEQQMEAAVVKAIEDVAPGGDLPDWLILRIATAAIAATLDRLVSEGWDEDQLDVRNTNRQIRGWLQAKALVAANRADAT